MATIKTEIKYASDNLYTETTTMVLNHNERQAVTNALMYYTDKRKLDFHERMLAGNMATDMTRELVRASNEAKEREKSNKQKG